MKLFVLMLCSVVATIGAESDLEVARFILTQDPNNVIDVPGKCPEGQKPDSNGKCRPVWDSLFNFDESGESSESEESDLQVSFGFETDPNNVIDVPGKCPEGQKPDGNGKCRPVWDYIFNTNNVIDVPGKCPEGYRPDGNGKCREVWDELDSIVPKGRLSAPVQ